MNPAVIGAVGQVLGGLLGRSKQKVISAGDNFYSHIGGIMNAARDFGWNPLTLLTNGQAIGPTVINQDNSAFGQAIANAGMLLGDQLSAKRLEKAKMEKLNQTQARLQKRLDTITLRSPVPGVYGGVKLPSDPEVYGGTTYPSVAGYGAGAGARGPAGSPAGLEPLRTVHPFDPRRAVDNRPMPSHSGWITIDNPITGPMNVPSLDGDEALSIGEYPTMLYSWATRERGLGYKAYSAMRDGTWRKYAPTVSAPPQNPLLDSVKRYGRKVQKRKDMFGTLGFN